MFVNRVNGKCQLYKEDGYSIQVASVLDGDLVAAAREGMDRVIAGDYETGQPPYERGWNPGDDPLRLRKIEMPQLANRAIGELVGSPVIGETVAAATGATMVQVWWVQLLYKPPTNMEHQAKTKVGWHQDWNYWHTSWQAGSELLTAWVALSDVTERSGPMKFVPGSHRWENVGGGDFFSQDNDQDSFVLPEGQTWREVAAVMSAGGMSLHDKLTLHGSGQNVSEGLRCSLAIHVRTEKSRPINQNGQVLTSFIDDLSHCPIIYGSRVASAFG